MDHESLDDESSRASSRGRPWATPGRVRRLGGRRRRGRRIKRVLRAFAHDVLLKLALESLDARVVESLLNSSVQQWKI